MLTPHTRSSQTRDESTHSQRQLKLRAVGLFFAPIVVAGNSHWPALAAALPLAAQSHLGAVSQGRQPVSASSLGRKPSCEERGRDHTRLSDFLPTTDSQATSIVASTARHPAQAPPTTPHQPRTFKRPDPDEGDRRPLPEDWRKKQHTSVVATRYENSHTSAKAVQGPSKQRNDGARWP